MEGGDPVDLLCILAFVGLLGCAVFALFLPRKPPNTFTSNEMDAFRHAQQVKDELAQVQGMVGPPKAPFMLSLGGAYLPAPKPDPPPKS
jgi:hypothetical protein